MLSTGDQESSSSTTGWPPTTTCSKKRNRVLSVMVLYKPLLTLKPPSQSQKSSRTTTSSSSTPISMPKSKSNSTKRVSKCRLFWRVLNPPYKISSELLPLACSSHKLNAATSTVSNTTSTHHLSTLSTASSWTSRCTLSMDSNQASRVTLNSAMVFLVSSSRLYQRTSHLLFTEVPTSMIGS